MGPRRAGDRVLVTGVSREIGIGMAIARRLDDDGWTVVTSGHPPYDDRMPWGADDTADPPGVRHVLAPLADADEPGRLIDEASSEGPLTALVVCHCESVDSSILDTTVESFDRHMDVNARATWLLIKAFAEQFPPASVDRAEPRGRIVSITSDHTAHNLPYGASKGAMDRIVLAAAAELAHLGITANVINPGATDTGWMSPEIEAASRARTLNGRTGRPDDVARLVAWLCSAEGRWVNRQLLHSDGGLR